MNYQTSITSKGQVTIPKEIRDFLKITTPSKLDISIDEKDKSIRLKTYPDFFKLAGTIKIKKIKNIMEAREAMEKYYERS